MKGDQIFALSSQGVPLNISEEIVLHKVLLNVWEVFFCKNDKFR